MLTFQEARDLYTNFKLHEFDKLQNNLNYYNGKHAILNKVSRQDKNDAKLVNNYPKYITTVATGYTGNIDYTNLHDFEEVSYIFKMNGESSIDSDELLFNSIFGKCYELNYLDEEGNYCFDVLDPRNCIVITDGSLRPKVTDAIIFDEKYLKENEVQVTMTVYDNVARSIYQYKRPTSFAMDTPNIDSFNLIEDNTPHMIGRCPVIEIKNNRWNKSDFEDVLSLVDAYNNATSLSMDDLTDFTDALLNIKNMSGTTAEDLKEAMKMKAIKTEGDGGVEWITKNVNDTYSENIKNRLKNDIHKFSFIPDISDEAFANNASGVAIKYKLLNLEQLRQEKVKWFKKAILTRLEMIASYLLTKGVSFNPYDLAINFKSNLPEDTTALINNATALNGLMSRESVLGYLGEEIVPDVKEEMSRIDGEKESQPLDTFQQVEVFDDKKVDEQDE